MKKEKKNQQGGRQIIQYVNIDKLKLNPLNPRFNDEAANKLINSIEAYGFTNPLIVREADNVIIAGHTRWKAAKAKGLTKVPVLYVDWDKNKANSYMLIDNKSNEWAEWDDLKLKEVIEQLQENMVKDSYELFSTMFDKDEINRILDEFEPDENEENQGSLDERNEIECPYCKKKFIN